MMGFDLVLFDLFRVIRGQILFLRLNPWFLGVWKNLSTNYTEQEKKEHKIY